MPFEKIDLQCVSGSARDVSFQCGSPRCGMSTRRTLGWSLVSSGIVTLVIGLLPLPDLFWGIVLLVAGVVALSVGR